MCQSAMFSGMALDWSSCVYSKLAFAPETPVTEVFEILRRRKEDETCVAIVESGRPIGLVSRAQIGILLGSNFGQCLFGKKPIGAYMSKDILLVGNGMSAQDVLSEALTRPAEIFHHDVILVDEQGNFGGLINLRALIQLQSALLASLQRRVSQMPE